MGLTTIDHEIRVRLKLNCLEYCVAEYLSRSPSQTTTGLLSHLHISVKQVSEALIKLYALGLIESMSNTVVTGRWRNEFKKRDTSENRVESFLASLQEFRSKYESAMIKQFFDYWSELNRSKTKMRWELEKTWDVSKRLARWYNNNNNNNNNNKSASGAPKEKVSYVIK